MGNGNVRRYMGGKQPAKFYKEDMWPQHCDIFSKLGLDLKKSLNLFMIFCKIDVDESGTVDLDEAFAFLGGTRTRYTERIFDIKEKLNSKSGLEFGQFAIVLWNFCSFSPANLARSIFEIYDPENKNTLERADIESMYRMMYDSDDYDITVLKRFPFNDEDVIKKVDFIDHCVHKRQLIKPAFDYQKRLRRYLGGTLLWDSLARYRERW